MVTNKSPTKERVVLSCEGTTFKNDKEFPTKLTQKLINWLKDVKILIRRLRISVNVM